MKMFIKTTIEEYLKEQKNNDFKIKKIRSFKTSEGNFSVYDVSADVVGRSDMFTVHEDKKGWIIRNAFVPSELQRKGISTDFYIKMNQLSKDKTGNNLKSTQSRTLSSGEVVHELSNDGIAFWDSLVSKGLAIKIGYKNYIFK